MEARTESIPLVTAMIDEELEKAECSPKAQVQIDIALDELLSNIVRYAYAPRIGEATVRFDFDPGERTATITFRDRGKPYNPLEAKEPDTTLPANQRKIGGLGIFLVRKTMDAMRYRYENGYNILEIDKKI